MKVIGKNILIEPFFAGEGPLKAKTHKGKIAIIGPLVEKEAGMKIETNDQIIFGDNYESMTLVVENKPKEYYLMSIDNIVVIL
jgi:co-chaperonin GroES (HSP10)